MGMERYNMRWYNWPSTDFQKDILFAAFLSVKEGGSVRIFEVSQKPSVRKIWKTVE